jgi:hypothetical protein
VGCAVVVRQPADPEPVEEPEPADDPEKEPARIRTVRHNSFPDRVME